MSPRGALSTARRSKKRSSRPTSRTRGFGYFLPPPLPLLPSAASSFCSPLTKTSTGSTPLARALSSWRASSSGNNTPCAHRLHSFCVQRNLDEQLYKQVLTKRHCLSSQIALSVIADLM